MSLGIAMSLADATVEAGLAGREFKVESRKDHWRSVMRIPEWEPLGAPTPGFLDVWETKELSGVNVVSAENTGVISRVLPTLARSCCKCGKEKSCPRETAEVRIAEELGRRRCIGSTGSALHMGKDSTLVY